MLNSREGVRVWVASQKTCRICRKVVHDASWIGHERQTNITGKECLHSPWRDAMGIYFNYINKRMKKIFTSIVLALCISVSVLAQTTTINVQGQQHKVNAAVAARIQKAAKAVASTGIDFSKIERWAGEGDCKAALAISGLTDKTTARLSFGAIAGNRLKRKLAKTLSVPWQKPTPHSMYLPDLVLPLVLPLVALAMTLMAIAISSLPLLKTTRFIRVMALYM